MVQNFKDHDNTADKPSSDKETLEVIDRLLELHGYETSDLIHQYYIERAKEQQALDSTPYGQLTVRCWFNENTLEVRISFLK